MSYSCRRNGPVDDPSIKGPPGAAWPPRRCRALSQRVAGKPVSRKQRYRRSIGAFLILLQASCVQPAVHSERPVPVESETGHYLSALYQFSNAGPQERAALYEHASTAAVLDPTASNRLQLALLKAWPGHPGYNPEAARQMLETALAQRYELAPETETLARVYLRIIEQQVQDMNRNRALSGELEEALDKLEALSRIERTVETTPRAEVEPVP